MKLIPLFIVLWSAHVLSVSASENQLCDHEWTNILTQQAEKISNPQKITIEASACKINPAHPEQMLVSYIALPVSATEDTDYLWNTLVFNAKNHQLQFEHQDSLVNDAGTRVESNSIQIDTANYKLTDNIRAFGVRLNTGYSPSCADAGLSDYLTLFIQQERTLKPVLKSLPMSFWHNRGDVPCSGMEATKPFTIEYAKSYIVLQPSSSHGFYNVQMVTKAETTEYIPGNTKEKIIRHRSFKNTIHYNGQQYDVGDVMNYPIPSWYD